MPTYEYECRACSHTFEAEQRIVEDPMKDCPSCGQENSLKRARPACGHPLQGIRLPRHRLRRQAQGRKTRGCESGLHGRPVLLPDLRY